MQNDFYERLGLTPQATQQEIKSAYRQLAKKHHPDLGGDAATFQKLTEAYETLSDPTKRQRYDDMQAAASYGATGFHDLSDFDSPLGDMFAHIFGFRQPRPTEWQNRNIRITVKVDFLETLDSVTKLVQVPLTNGSDNFEIEIPAGIATNTLVTLRGRGDNADPNKPRGNLEVLIKVNPHPKFERLDADIRTDVTIDCFQAIVGTEIDIETPRSGFVTLTIPPGTQYGAQFGIPDQGFPKRDGSRGKLIIRVNVSIPTALTAQQTELVEQIVSSRPENK